MRYGIKTLDDVDVKGKTVLCRVDMNCPVDAKTGQLLDVTRIERCAPTIIELSATGARLVLLTHQGGDLEYMNYASTKHHARVLSELTGRQVSFIDDICGPYARRRIQRLNDGEIVLLDNVRFMAEEMTMFEKTLRLSPQEQAKTVVVRRLAPLADLYVCDAFAAIHRSQPTLIGFAELLPSAMGRLFEQELMALERVGQQPERPCFYVLGGAKIEDALAIASSVLKDNICDRVLTSGLLANIMLIAKGVDIGRPSWESIAVRHLDVYVELAQSILEEFGDRIALPSDLAYIRESRRSEVGVGELPVDQPVVDIGRETVRSYCEALKAARTVFLNGPAGVFEKPESEYGTKSIWEAVAYSHAYSVIGGGDSLAAANKYGLAKRFSYQSTAGGGLVRLLSGEELPVIRALRNAAEREVLETTVATQADCASGGYPELKRPFT
jgi:phosphoglycerate kinase